MDCDFSSFLALNKDDYTKQIWKKMKSFLNSLPGDMIKGYKEKENPVFILIYPLLSRFIYFTDEVAPYWLNRWNEAPMPSGEVNFLISLSDWNLQLCMVLLINGE